MWKAQRVALGDGRAAAAGPSGPAACRRFFRSAERSFRKASGSNAPTATRSVLSGRKTSRNRFTSRPRVRARTVSLGPEDRGAERVVGPVGPDERLVEAVLRDVVRLGHLLEDDLPLGLDVLGREGRRFRQVQQEGERVGQSFGRRPGVDRHPLLRGVGVAVAAKAVGRPGNRRARAAAGSAEEEVLEEVGRSEGGGLLVGRASRHVDAEGDAPHVAHRVEPDGQAVAEGPGFHGADLTVGPGESVPAAAGGCGTPANSWAGPHS